MNILSGDGDDTVAGGMAENFGDNAVEHAVALASDRRVDMAGKDTAQSRAGLLQYRLNLLPVLDNKEIEPLNVNLEGRVVNRHD